MREQIEPFLGPSVCVWTYHKPTSFYLIGYRIYLTGINMLRSPFDVQFALDRLMVIRIHYVHRLTCSHFYRIVCRMPPTQQQNITQAHMSNHHTWHPSIFRVQIKHRRYGGWHISRPYIYIYICKLKKKKYFRRRPLRITQSNLRVGICACRNVLIC